MIMMENASSYKSPAISIMVGDMIDSSSSTHDHGGDENNKLAVSLPLLLLRVWIQGATVLCLLEGLLLVFPLVLMIPIAVFALVLIATMLAIMLSTMVPGDATLLPGMIVVLVVLNSTGLWILFVGGLALRPFINLVGNFRACCVLNAIMSIVVVFGFEYKSFLVSVQLAMIGVCTIEMWNRYHVRQYHRAAILGLAPWLPLLLFLAVKQRIVLRVFSRECEA
jgi:hypothetical protein